MFIIQVKVTLVCEGDHNIKVHKTSGKPNSNNFEKQLKYLQKHFGSIVVTVKDFKSSVNCLERKVDEREDEELKGHHQAAGNNQQSHNIKCRSNKETGRTSYEKKCGNRFTQVS